MPVPPTSPTTSMQPVTEVRLRQDLPRGTIVEVLDENTVLVEFADENGKTLELTHLASGYTTAATLIEKIESVLNNPSISS